MAVSRVPREIGDALPRGGTEREQLADGLGGSWVEPFDVEDLVAWITPIVVRPSTV